MRIIGGHDYYDTALAFGQDRDRVFQRNTNGEKTAFEALPDTLKVFTKNIIEKRVHHGWWHGSSLSDKNDFRLEVYPFAIVFAGSLYHGCMCSLSKGFMNNVTGIFYDPDAVISWLVENDYDIETMDTTALCRDFLTEKRRKKKTPLERLRDNLDFIGADKPLHAEVIGCLIENNISILSVEPKGEERLTHITVGINGSNMKEFQLYKVLDAFSAFQKLSEWTGGILSAAENNMIKLSDKELAKKHGYDKWSFRKMPSN